VSQKYEFLENEYACNLFPSRKKIILGIAQQIKFLALPEVRPNLICSLEKYTKVLEKIIKGKRF
jgi:hypothetical protein